MNRPSTSATRILPVTPRGQKTRQKLLRAAETIFGEKGYEHASIADITRKSGVALGTFYVYFPDKQSIFVEVVDELGERLRRLIAEAVVGLEHRIDVEREGLRTFFEFAREHPNLYRVVRQAEFVDEACYRRYYDRFAKGYVRGLNQAMDAGQIRRMDAESLAYCLMGIGDFLGMRWVIWGGDLSIDGVLDTAMALIQHGMDPRPGARVGKAPAKASTKAPSTKAAATSAKRGTRAARNTLRSTV